MSDFGALRRKCAVDAQLTFWTSLWGPIGLVLATPETICLVVLEKAEEFLKERPLSIYYDDGALKGLKLAAADVARGSLDAAGTEKIKAVTKELVDDLDDQDDSTEPRAKTQDAEAAAAVDSIVEEVPRPSSAWQQCSASVKIRGWSFTSFRVNRQA